MFDNPARRIASLLPQSAMLLAIFILLSAEPVYAGRVLPRHFDRAFWVVGTVGLAIPVFLISDAIEKHARDSASSERAEPPPPSLEDAFKSDRDRLPKDAYNVEEEFTFAVDLKENPGPNEQKITESNIAKLLEGAFAAGKYNALAAVDLTDNPMASLIDHNRLALIIRTRFSPEAEINRADIGAKKIIALDQDSTAWTSRNISHFHYRWMAQGYAASRLDANARMLHVQVRLWLTIQRRSRAESGFHRFPNFNSAALVDLRNYIESAVTQGFRRYAIEEKLPVELEALRTH